MLNLDLTQFLVIILVEDFSEVDFQVIHAGVYPSAGELADLVVDYMLVDASVGDLFVAVSIGQDLGDLG